MFANPILMSVWLLTSLPKSALHLLMRKQAPPGLVVIRYAACSCIPSYNVHPPSTNASP